MAQHNTPTHKTERQPDKGRAGEQSQGRNSGTPQDQNDPETSQQRGRQQGDQDRGEKGAMRDRPANDRAIHETEPKGQRLVANENDEDIDDDNEDSENQSTGSDATDLHESEDEGDDETTARGGGHTRSPKVN